MDKQLLGKSMLYVFGGTVTIVAVLSGIIYAGTHFGELFWYSVLALAILGVATAAVYEQLLNAKHRQESYATHNEYGHRIV